VAHSSNAVHEPTVPLADQDLGDNLMRRIDGEHRHCRGYAIAASEGVWVVHPRRDSGLQERYDSFFGFVSVDH
jgi:hypothetical protein